MKAIGIGLTCLFFGLTIAQATPPTNLSIRVVPNSPAEKLLTPGLVESLIEANQEIYHLNKDEAEIVWYGRLAIDQKESELLDALIKDWTKLLQIAEFPPKEILALKQTHHLDDSIYAKLVFLVDETSKQLPKANEAQAKALKDLPADFKVKLRDNVISKYTDK